MVPDPMVSELPKGSLVPEVVEPEKTKKKGNKRAASGISVSSVEGTSAEAQSDEPSKKKTKKKKKKSVEEHAEPDEGGSNDSPGDPLERKKRKKQSVDHDASVLTERDNSHASEERGEAGVRRPTPPRVAAPTIGSSGLAPRKSRIKFPDHVEFKYDGDIPLSYASAECTELIRQMRGGPRDTPAHEFRHREVGHGVEGHTGSAGARSTARGKESPEGETAPAADELIASKETSDNAPQLGGKVVTSPGGTQVGEGVLEISDSSSEDRSEGDPVEKTTGSELGDAEKSPGARSKLIETIEATPVDEQTEGISVDHPNSSADVPDRSVPPVANASED
ncbi:hypothetical protein F2Q69_00042413 [Brassica cretica]|uniref:Uncharacterized protein n=1 Tax=Brassica cretica TaxID=69181 RepID=A0A8S9NBW6_BRACR|nr:hypothetical protein F2Q69_00042413 [Brassica cretica]